MQKYALLLFFMLASLFLDAQKIFISADSLPFEFNEKWKYFPADSISLEGVDVNDESWSEIKSSIHTDSLRRSFNGKGWFRLHFSTDSSITLSPVAIALKQYGASEIYLDGVKIGSFGTISDSSNSIYINPENSPFIFNIKNAGEHVLAAHYVNYAAHENTKIYFSRMSGFLISINRADFLVKSKLFQASMLTFIYIILAGIFITLSLIHLLLFLYYRTVRSNLYFSIFTFSAALLFFLGFVSYFFRNDNDRI
jgi:hypothetical protein